MSTYDYSLVLIIPAALQAEANALSCAMGQDVMPGHTFSVPLSADGQEPPTHFGCHAWSQPGFAAVLAAAQAGALPDDPAGGGEWSDYGLGLEAIAAVVSALIVSVREDLTGAAHFAAVLDDAGLVRIEERS
jgi:hypothetical protein